MYQRHCLINILQTPTIIHRNLFPHFNAVYSYFLKKKREERLNNIPAFFSVSIWFIVCLLHMKNKFSVCSFRFEFLSPIRKCQRSCVLNSICILNRILMTMRYACQHWQTKCRHWLNIYILEVQRNRNWKQTFHIHKLKERKERERKGERG